MGSRRGKTEGIHNNGHMPSRAGVHAVSKSEIVEACSDSVVFGGTGFFCLPQLVETEAIENMRVGIKL
jgi:hypothetical protein